MVAVEVQDQALMAAIARAVQQTSAPVAVLESIGGTLEESVQGRFDSKVAPDGTFWSELAESTQSRYAKADKGRSQGTLLERTGQMRATLASQVTRDGAAYVLQVGMSRRTDGGRTGPLGGDWAIPLLHEFGTQTMPRRGLFTVDPEAGTLSDDDRDAIIADMADFVARAFAP